MPSLQVLIRHTGHRKVKTNAMKACRNWVKQWQYIFPHYQLGHVSPGHAPVVGVCMCCVSPCLRFASHMRRRTVRVVVVLLLLLSGDVETNPGPVGEVVFLTL